MVRVEIQVRSGPACFNVVVRARSIRRALSMVETRFSCDQARVVHPIDPEAFFEGGPPATEELAYGNIPRRAKDGLKATG